MELDLVRNELNKLDNIIKNMLVLRMSLIPIVADIKVKNNLPLFQAKREEEIYEKLKSFSNENGLDENLLKDIYKTIISNALDIEHSIVEDSNNSIINKKISMKNLENLKVHFEKIDNIVEKEIPETISKIVEECDIKELNLNQIATLYYNNKVNGNM